MDKSNIVIGSLLGLSIAGYVVLSALDKDIQLMQSVVSLFIGILAGHNGQPIGRLVMSGAKKVGFIK